MPNPYHIHLIAIGGSAMHNLALALQKNGHHVTGSDDEIYEPAKSRLAQHNLLPQDMGWNENCIHKDLDVVILGMHARADNPELLKAQQLGLKIYSYPEYLYELSKNKQRFVIAGSHGKTSTTAMVMHALQFIRKKFDYLVGAKLEGFDLMVQISDADTIIIEGDEYLSSPIDRIPKIHHYHPHVSVITGIAWDHINVFPTFENYILQFEKYIDLHEEHGTIIYNTKDPILSKLCTSYKGKALEFIPYDGLEVNQAMNIVYDAKAYEYHLVGNHNLQNAHAAMLMCMKMGITADQFLSSLSSFKGAAKRLQRLPYIGKNMYYLDFAHAPSKVTATVDAVKAWYNDRQVLAVLELHTFSSLNPDFLPQYARSLDSADQAIVYYDSHTLEIKKMAKLDTSFIRKCFDHSNIKIIDNRTEFHTTLDQIEDDGKVVLLMSSGNFGGYQFV